MSVVLGVGGRDKPGHDERREITTGLAPGTYTVPRESGHVSIGLSFARTGLSVVHGVDGRVKPDHDERCDERCEITAGLVRGIYAVPRESAYVAKGLSFARPGLSVVLGVGGRDKPGHDGFR